MIRLIFKILTILCALVIAYLSLAPAGGTATYPHIDKVQHAVAYAGLSGLMGLGWTRLRLLWLGLIAILFGVAIELAQGLSGLGRTASGLDVLANTAGVGLALIILYSWRTRQSENRLH